MPTPSHTLLGYSLPTVIAPPLSAMLLPPTSTISTPLVPNSSLTQHGHFVHHSLSLTIYYYSLSCRLFPLIPALTRHGYSLITCGFSHPNSRHSPLFLPAVSHDSPIPDPQSSLASSKVVPTQSHTHLGNSLPWASCLFPRLVQHSTSLLSLPHFCLPILVPPTMPTMLDSPSPLPSWPWLLPFTVPKPLVVPA